MEYGVVCYIHEGASFNLQSYWIVYCIRKYISIFLDFYWTTHPPDRSILQCSIGQFFIKSIFVGESGQNLHTFCHAMCVLATGRIVYIEQKHLPYHISALHYIRYWTVRCITWLFISNLLIRNIGTFHF